MQYMLLIYRAESKEPPPILPEFKAFMDGFSAFTQEVKGNQKLVTWNALDKVEMSTTVRICDDKIDTFNGPFAETKEQLGGYYVLDCDDLDEAIDYAAKLPAGRE
jgi:hypothetical protein